MPVTLAKLAPTVYVGMAGLVVATTLQIVSATTTYWSHLYNDTSLVVIRYHAGLYKQCINEKCYDMTSESVNNPVKGLTVLAIMSGLFAGCLMLTFITMVLMGTLKSKALATSALVFCIISGIFSLIGCTMYGLAIGKANSYIAIMSYKISSLHVDYSFFLCLTAGILYIPVGILLQCGASRVIASVRNEGGLIINEAPAVQITQTGMDLEPQPWPGMMFQGQGQHLGQINSTYAPNPDMTFGPLPPQQQQPQKQKRQMLGPL